MDRVSKVKGRKTENETNLPKGWKKVRLGEVLSFKNGKSPQIIDSGTYPVYGSNGLIGFTNDYFLDGDFLLVGRVGASGETHLVSGKLWASDNCLIGECKSDVILVFIYYLLKYFDLKKFITQTAQPLITQFFISNLQILLPPLPEQRKIAEILETVDKAIEKTDRIIEKYKRIKQGLMQDLLTKGIDENGRIRSEETHRFKDSPLGRIPEEWEVVELGEIGKIVTGSTPPTKKEEFYGEEYLFISPEDITEAKYINKSAKKLSRLGFKISRKIPSKSVCVVCIGSTIGKVALTLEDCTTNQQINTIIPNKNVYDSETLYYFVLFYAQKPLRQEAGLQAVPIVNKSRFSKIQIPLPPLSEQKRIASILSQIDETIEKEQKYKEKLERIKRGLMEDLLTGKVRVDKLLEEQ